MSDIEFIEETRQAYGDTYQRGSQKSTLVTWFVKSGLMSSETTAQIFIVGAGVLLIAASFFIVMGNKKEIQVTYREDLPRDVVQRLPKEILDTFPSKNQK